MPTNVSQYAASLPAFKDVTVYRAYFESNYSLTVREIANKYLPGYTLFWADNSAGDSIAVLEYATSEDHLALIQRVVMLINAELGQKCAMLTRTVAQVQCTCKPIAVSVTCGMCHGKGAFHGCPECGRHLV